MRRGSYRCEYCKTPVDFSPEPFDIEHIIPLSKGGSNDLDNLAFACGGCNGYKSARTEGIDPADGNIGRFFNPRKDAWADHFSWSQDFRLIVGLTPVGRTTVTVLQMNRQGLLNLRRLMISAGEHPPVET